MITPQIRIIAKELENLGRQKIKLAEAVLERTLSEEEKDRLYAAAIRDQFGLISQVRPEIKFTVSLITDARIILKADTKGSKL
jgi:hypothetical protein